jgi:hypothetical protein
MCLVGNLSPKHGFADSSLAANTERRRTLRSGGEEAMTSLKLASAPDEFDRRQHVHEPIVPKRERAPSLPASRSVGFSSMRPAGRSSHTRTDQLSVRAGPRQAGRGERRMT